MFNSIATTNSISLTDQTGLFSTALLPTVEYVSLMQQCKKVALEAHENFQKQTNRSRFHILSPNGIQTLQIPLVHAKKQHQPVTETEISYQSSWQMQHWRSIETAYNRSPFFEFYKDELKDVYFKKEKLLFSYNLNLLRWILKILNINIEISYTDIYERELLSACDFRKLSNSKNNSVVYIEFFNPVRYQQVFDYKFEFTKNLSTLDLIFNCGKRAIDYL